MANNIDPKYGASGAQLSASTRRAMARRRKPVTGIKIANPINRIPKPVDTNFGKNESYPQAPLKAAPLLNEAAPDTTGLKPNIPNTITEQPAALLKGSNKTLKIDPKYGYDMNKSAKKKPMMAGPELANYNMSKSMDRGVRKALRMPLA